MPWKFSDRSAGTRVILVRHGQSTFNAAGRYQGRSDQPILTAIGRRSAYQTGVMLAGLQIDAIYTSPLQRAVETAREILAVRCSTETTLPPVQASELLQEIDLPEWQGLAFKYVREQFASAYRCWQERPDQFQLVSSTNSPVATVATQRSFPVLDLYAQAQQFWQQILPRHFGQTVLVVSHSGTNRALISTAINLSPQRYHALQQSNCGISSLRFCGHKTAQLESLNLTAHLDEVLPKLKQGKQGLRLLLVPSTTINLAQMQRLAKWLQTVTIDFCLSNDLNNSQQLAAQLLQYHTETLQLQALQPDFPQVWHHVISSRLAKAANADPDSAQLTTGLVVAGDSIIQSFLSQAIGINSNDGDRLRLQSGTVSVIHYPVANCCPVLQAINLTDPGRLATLWSDSSLSAPPTA